MLVKGLLSFCNHIRGVYNPSNRFVYSLFGCVEIRVSGVVALGVIPYG